MRDARRRSLIAVQIARGFLKVTGIDLSIGAQVSSKDALEKKRQEQWPVGRTTGGGPGHGVRVRWPGTKSRQGGS